MRLTCPNCDAQYEVPDEVIPSKGRDVQCSNCGDTWFQSHDNPPVQPLKPAPKPDAPTDETPTKAQLDPSVKDILREEAALEAKIRATEIGNTLESQPNLGLDDLPDETVRRAQEARDRMARIRGATPQPVATAEAITEAVSEAVTEAEAIEKPHSRRGLLPDIEEINSSLRANGNSPMPPIAAVTASGRKNKSGFTRGFAIVLLVAAAMLVVYVKAPQISQSFPRVDPALNAYVAGIDKARIWLDTRIGKLVPEKND